MPKTVSLEDVTQDVSGYRAHFSDCVMGFDTFEDMAAYVVDLYDRAMLDALKAILVARWIYSNHLGETATVTYDGQVTISG